MLTFIIQGKSGTAPGGFLVVALVRCGSDSEVGGSEDEIQTIKIGLLFAMLGVLGVEGLLWRNGAHRNQYRRAPIWGWDIELLAAVPDSTSIIKVINLRCITHFSQIYSIRRSVIIYL
jgi:hypothetical protein